MMKTFAKLAGASMRWRHRTVPYGDGRSGRRKIEEKFYDKMQATFCDFWLLSGLGPASIIVSAGAYVAKRGRHGEGRAIDIDAIRWHGADLSIIAKEFEALPAIYLATEAIFRMHCGTVLGWLYNEDHHCHWHIDDGSRVCYRENSRSRVLFVQASLKHVWGIDVGTFDGRVGKKTRKGIEKVSKKLVLGPMKKKDEWLRYLMCTAIEGFH